MMKCRIVGHKWDYNEDSSYRLCVRCNRLEYKQYGLWEKVPEGCVEVFV